MKMQKRNPNLLVIVQALNIIQRARQQSDPESSGQKIMAPIVDIRLVTGKEPTPEGFTRHVICLSGRKRQAKGGDMPRPIRSRARALQTSSCYHFVFNFAFQ